MSGPACDFQDMPTNAGGKKVAGRGSKKSRKGKGKKKGRKRASK